DERLGDSLVLDVGTGNGRVAIALAPLARAVVGVDREVDAIGDARSRALAAGRTNVSFVVADADVADYRTLVSAPPSLVTAHLFMSDALVAHAADVLAPGGALAVVSFHVDQWKETGRPSRFAYTEESMQS